ncbi:hypothetical protein VFPFJ_07414 [Purpureocillium lilacinum]|uniref:Uncharacterized protein n=1 Tax=Purpureocillium lilacinum TaxID=33203 RepID=A0A179GQM3_PURLI|nr:hypothetical protein VFPFJ_07414 [Purpureocillium lilacinum]OAQ79650.1 hypothetical protein VFPBJ_05235 [Purpureocillium lilacinum]OAQ88949.1 hypothetical protein VFPFJ_07414 [Purpureocillium lilacinum]
MRASGLHSVVAVTGLLGSVSGHHKHGSSCEEVPIVEYQPVAVVCSGSTTASTITRTYNGCAPTSCVVTVSEFPVTAANITTKTVIGTCEGTRTLPVGPGGDTTVIVTETPGCVITKTTKGPKPGTTTLKPNSAPESLQRGVYGIAHGLVRYIAIKHDGFTHHDFPHWYPVHFLECIKYIYKHVKHGHGQHHVHRFLHVRHDFVHVNVRHVYFDNHVGDFIKHIHANHADNIVILHLNHNYYTDDPDNVVFIIIHFDHNHGDHADDIILVYLHYNHNRDDSHYNLVNYLDDYHTDRAQVYLNQQIPRCGDPPPEVTLTIRFDYQFTGDSEGCSIGAAVNRETTNLVTITDEGVTPGEWQHYEGQPITVQLTYDSLFTLKLMCDSDTPNTPGILITDITIY